MYDSGLTTSAVRILKGQDVLADDSTLREFGIADGDTLNIVIEPDKEINVTVRVGPKTFSQTVSHSLPVAELKRMLHDKEQSSCLVTKRV